MKGLAAIVALSCVAAGCGGGAAPTVRVIEASPAALDPSRDEADDLTIRVAYADEDGDLGGGVAEVHDCRREGLVLRLPIPAIASQAGVEEAVSIEGELSLVVADVGEVAADAGPPAACEALGVGAPSGGAQAFCVVLTDAAGNAGEGDCTGRVRVSVVP